jgi:hypothetical protein
MGFALVAATPASAGTIQLSGVQSGIVTPGTEGCQIDDPLYAGTPVQENVMTGSLVGCWYTDTFNPNPAQPSGTPSGEIQGTGMEHFIGCLDLNGEQGCGGPGDPNFGTLETAFQATFKFDLLTGLEVHGRCHHPIIPGSGTGVFTGATGSVTFNDDVGIDSGDGSSLYRAHVTL